MSGTRHSDTHVEYILDTETWLGPYEDTPFEVVAGHRGHDRRVRAEGRGAPGSPAGAVVEADLQRRRSTRPRRSPGSRTTSTSRRRTAPGDLGQLVHGLVDEGKAVAARGGDRAPRRPVGDERPRDAAWLGALPVDARGRRRASRRPRSSSSPARSFARRGGTTCRCRCTRCSTRSSEARKHRGRERRNRQEGRDEEGRKGDARSGRRGGRRRRRRRRRDSGVAAGEDRDHRLGLRRRREHGAVRRPRARDREDAHRAGQQGSEHDEAPADHVQHAGQQARDREGVRDEARSRRARTSS